MSSEIVDKPTEKTLSLYVWKFYNGSNPCTFMQVSDSVESIIANIETKQFPGCAASDGEKRKDFVKCIGPYATIRTKVHLEREKKEIERQRRNRKETRVWAESQIRRDRIGFCPINFPSDKVIIYDTLKEYLTNIPPTEVRSMFTPIIISALQG